MRYTPIFNAHLKIRILPLHKLLVIFSFLIRIKLSKGFPLHSRICNNLRSDSYIYICGAHNQLRHPIQQIFIRYFRMNTHAVMLNGQRKMEESQTFLSRQGLIQQQTDHALPVFQQLRGTVPHAVHQVCSMFMQLKTRQCVKQWASNVWTFRVITRSMFFFFVQSINTLT